MKCKFILATRITLGLIFLVMGLNGLFHFFTLQVEGEKAKIFMTALKEIEYFWPFEKILEVTFGVFLLTKKFVPLAIEGLAPIIVNIMFYHLFLDWNGILLASVTFTCHLILFVYLWPNHFRNLFHSRCEIP